MMFPSYSPLMRALLWMGGALLSFIAMAIAGREMSAELSPFQIVFYRASFGLIVVVALLSRLGFRAGATARPGLQFVRHLAHFGGQVGWFTGIALIPLAEVFALEFTAPVWAALLAVAFFGERLTRRRGLAILLGFVGVLVILRPGAALIDPASLAVLGGAICYAFTYVLTRSLMRTDGPLSILLYMNLLHTPLALLASWGDWSMPSDSLYPWILLLGVSGLTAVYCLSRALALADTSVVIPLDFVRLPLIAVIGALAYGEAFDPLVLVGAAIVVAGNLINVHAAKREGG